MKQERNYAEIVIQGIETAYAIQLAYRLVGQMSMELLKLNIYAVYELGLTKTLLSYLRQFLLKLLFA